MATILQGTQERLLRYGNLITYSWTLPASATTNTLFTATGGLVIVTSLVGQVTTLIGSTATTLAVGLGTPGVGGTLDTDGIGTATTITSQEVGTLISPLASSGLGGALAVGSLAGSVVFQANPFVVNSATITATTSANAGGGVINWYLTYIPLDNGAYIHT
jgi:hypothetical protein